jgi:hypothetical protein
VHPGMLAEGEGLMTWLFRCLRATDPHICGGSGLILGLVGPNDFQAPSPSPCWSGHRAVREHHIYIDSSRVHQRSTHIQMPWSVNNNGREWCDVELYRVVTQHTSRHGGVCLSPHWAQAGFVKAYIAARYAHSLPEDFISQVLRVLTRTRAPQGPHAHSHVWTHIDPAFA